MNVKSVNQGFLALFASLAMLTAVPAFAQSADPTPHQVYQAAEAGNYAEAQSMLDRVMRDYPAKAEPHYIEAQLLARQGQYAAAGRELQTAQRLEPGLPFARPEAVAQLQALIASNGRGRAYGSNYGAPSSGSHFGGPVMLFAIGAVVIFLIITLVRATRRLTPMMSSGPAGYPGPGMGSGMPVYPMGGMPMGGMPMGGGMGSGILGGLATGAALGAGVVAGEELMHHVLDPSRSQGYAPSDSGAPPADDMGGRDFGVNDGSSWDDSGSSLSDGMSDGGGGGDWN